MAFRLVDLVRELAFTAQWRLMLPLLSEQKDDIARLHAAMDRCLAWSSLLAFPLCAVMAVAIQPLVSILLGPVWQPSGVASLPLIALTAWLFLAFPAGVGVIARGEPRYTLIANIAGTLATVFGVLLLRPVNPMQAVLVWLGAQMFVSPYVLCANARVLGTTPLRPVRAGVPMLGASVLATAIAFLVPHDLAPAWLLVARVAVVAAICLPVMVVKLWRASGPIASHGGKVAPNCLQTARPGCPPTAMTATDAAHSARATRSPSSIGRSPARPAGDRHRAR